MQSNWPDKAEGGWRLLLCDDSDSERSALAVLLRRRGYEVDEAADGNSALVMLKARRYDLVLLDLQMPMMDGFEVLAWIQKHTPEQPVVVLSGLPAEEIGEGILRLPEHELPPLLLKPIRSEQLFPIIDMKLAGELP